MRCFSNFIASLCQHSKLRKKVCFCSWFKVISWSRDLRRQYIFHDTWCHMVLESRRRKIAITENVSPGREEYTPDYLLCKELFEQFWRAGFLFRQSIIARNNISKSCVIWSITHASFINRCSLALTIKSDCFGSVSAA